LTNWSRDLPTSLTWKIGDVISIVNGLKYDFCSEITAVDTTNMTITVNSLPFSKSAYASLSGLVLNPDDMEIIVPRKSTEGQVDFGWGAFASGLENKAVGSFSNAMGYKNLTAGDFSMASGRENETAYAAFATGDNNKAHGQSSIAVGIENQTLNKYTATFGRLNTASGQVSFASGNST
jgi:hypothetical protein